MDLVRENQFRSNGGRDGPKMGGRDGTINGGRDGALNGEKGLGNKWGEGIGQ